MTHTHALSHTLTPATVSIENERDQRKKRSELREETLDTVVDIYIIIVAATVRNATNDRNKSSFKTNKTNERLFENRIFPWLGINELCSQKSSQFIYF